jgi:hypothetical protein
MLSGDSHSLNSGLIRSLVHQQARCLLVSTLSLLYVPSTPFQRSPCDERVCQAASGVTSSYDALLELFECLGNFLKRLQIYTTIPPTPILTDVMVKIMVELLSVLALASKQIKEGRFSTCNVRYITCRSMWHREVQKKVAWRERDRERA